MSAECALPRVRQNSLKRRLPAAGLLTLAASAAATGIGQPLRSARPVWESINPAGRAITVAAEPGPAPGFLPLAFGDPAEEGPAPAPPEGGSVSGVVEGLGFDPRPYIEDCLG